ncbi:hypothetical protein RYX36_009092 [Vicia faba]
MVKQFKSWSGIEYYQKEISALWDDFKVIQASKTDSRLANNNLPLDIQKLRCRACFEALRFSPRIEKMGKLLVERMRSFGPYITLHLRYEKDMLAFSGCTHDLSTSEAEELRIIRENTTYWKRKHIDPTEERSKGNCPLTPKEVGIFLSALGYPTRTPIYIAAGEIYGGESHMTELRSRYLFLMSKEKLASIDELEPFSNHASQMAALDYIVSIESDVFVHSYPGNMARVVQGHRRFLGKGRTVSPDRFPRKQYLNGQSVVASVMALPSLETSGRLLLHLNEVNRTSSSKRTKKSSYKVGSLVEAEITDIKTFELKLKFGFGLHGRVHITEVHDANDLENPFSGYKIGQTVTARIVSKPNDADSSRNGSRWELSVRPEMVTGQFVKSVVLEVSNTVRGTVQEAV